MVVKDSVKVFSKDSNPFSASPETSIWNNLFSVSSIISFAVMSSWPISNEECWRNSAVLINSRLKARS